MPGIIIVVVLFILLAYYLYSQSGAIRRVPQFTTPYSSIIKDGSHGLFLKSVKPPYTDGLSKDAASAFCQSYGGQLANNDQLTLAFQQGFSYNSLAWSQKAPASVLQKPGPECGGSFGVCYMPDNSFETSKLGGAFCYGKLPPSTDFKDITYPLK